MTFAGINTLAVLLAAVAGFAFGGVWYRLFAGPWMKAAGLDEETIRSGRHGGGPSPFPFVIAFLAQLLMAWMLAGLVGHLGAVTVSNAVVSAFFVWLGFSLTTILVNHRFQMLPWSLTLIDGGHWLGVLLIQGLVIGLLGA